MEKKESPCMGMIRKAVENQQKSQVLSVVAIGVSVFALLCVFAMIGAKNNGR